MNNDFYKKAKELGFYRDAAAWGQGKISKEELFEGLESLDEETEREGKELTEAFFDERAARGEREKGVVEETDDFKVAYSDLYMRKKAPRGSINVKVKGGENEDPYVQDDVKISDHNIKQFVSNVTGAEGLDEEESDDLFSLLLQLKFEAKNKAQENSSEAKHKEEREDLNVDSSEIEELSDPSYLLSVMRETDDSHVGDYTLKGISLLSALSRTLTGMPLNLWSVGGSGSGKTHCFQTLFKAIPNEYKIKFNSCSPKALYYFTKKYDPEVLDGKVVLFNEAEASEEAKEVLRSITDPNEEEQNLLSVMDQQSLEITIKGSPVTWFTSVDPIDDQQLKNRFMFSNPNEGSNHKKKVAEFQKERGRRGELQPIKEKDYQGLKAAFRDIVENTKDYNVLIPFDWEWNREEDARLQPYFMNIVHILAKVHYRDRPIIEGNVIATLEDYFLAKFLWHEVEEITLQQVKENDLELLEHIPEKHEWVDDRDDDEEEGDIGISRSGLEEAANLGYDKVRHATERLQNAGLIVGKKSNGKWLYYKKQEGVAQAAISLVQQSLDDKSILNFLEEFNLVAQNSGETDTPHSKVVDQIKEVGECGVRVFDLLYAIYEDRFKEFISDLNDDEAAKIDLAGSAIGSEEDKGWREEKQEEGTREERGLSDKDILEQLSEESDLGPAFVKLSKVLKEEEANIRTSKVMQYLEKELNYDRSFIRKQLKREDGLKVENDRIYAIKSESCKTQNKLILTA